MCRVHFRPPESAPSEGPAAVQLMRAAHVVNHVLAPTCTCSHRQVSITLHGRWVFHAREVSNPPINLGPIAVNLMTPAMRLPETLKHLPKNSKPRGDGEAAAFLPAGAKEPAATAVRLSGAAEKDNQSDAQAVRLFFFSGSSVQYLQTDIAVLLDLAVPGISCSTAACFGSASLCKPPAGRPRKLVMCTA